MRLRYRLEMSENLTEAESLALNRDIGQLEALIEELLTYARLDRPQNELKLTTPISRRGSAIMWKIFKRLIPSAKSRRATFWPAITARWICA